MGKKLLFICLGNICRSPAAEGIMKKLVNDKNLSSQIFCDSAGTSSLHEGARSDARMIEHARRRGYILDGRSRPVVKRDLEEFDYLLVMDKKNMKDVRSMDSAGKFGHKIIAMTHFCTRHDVDEVPDPYYDGAEGFETVLDILEDSCAELLRWLIQGEESC